MVSGNLLFASDKSVRDALLKRKFKNADLKELFFSRGIIVSKETERRKLANYFSLLNHDYYDHKQIASILGIVSRKEKTSISGIKNIIDNDSIERAIQKVCVDQQEVGEYADFKATPNGYKLTINYTHIDYGKSDFSQITQKEAEIFIENNSEGLIIRWPFNEYVEEIKENLIDSLNDEYGENQELEIDEIELSNITDPSLRTKFFTEMINSIENLHSHDVTDVYVYHPKELNEDDTDEDPDELGIHISKASLKGEGVLNSDELRSLYARGFYISKIIWIAKTSDYTSDLYEIVAQFSDAELCKKFSYMILGVYKYKAGGKHNKGRTAISVIEESKILKLIESAAKASLNNIRKEVIEKG